QGVEPDPDGKRLVERDADAPTLAVARDGDVLQPFVADQGDDLIAAALRLDEVGPFLVELQQPVLELGLLEVIARLAAADQWRTRVQRAVAAGLLDLLFGLERLAAFAVPALVLVLADVPGVVYLLDERPAAAVVPLLARLHERVVTDLQGVPDLAELLG